MRIACLAFFWLFTLSLPAQITLLIEDETQQGFRLVADGFIQNARPVNKLALSELPSSEHQLILLLNNQEQDMVKRKLQLSGNGIHSYVVMRNFAGKLQLRYRGKQASVPPEYSREKYNRLLAYTPQQTVAANTAKAQEKAEEVAEASNTPPPAPEPPASTNNQTQEAENKRITAAPAQEAPALIKPEPDSAKAAKPRISIATDTPKVVKIEETFTIAEAEGKVEENEAKPGFESLFQELRQQEFEFDKLRVANEKIAQLELSAPQVVQVLKEFKYDQTRFQFLAAAAKNNPSLRHSADLFKPQFEYELSRQKVAEILKNNE